MGIVLGGLCALRIWLGAALPLRAMGSFALDDLLYARMAISLVHGQWLGTYDEDILAVGPFYPMWVALSYRLGVPLILSQQLLYVAACLAVFLVLKPLVNGPILRLSIFAAMLFGPFSFDYEATRVLRDNVYTSQTLLVFAAMLGLLGTRLDATRARWAWSAGAGVVLSTFWLTREEGIWVIPTLAILLGYSLWRSWPAGGRARVTQLAIHALPPALCAVSVFALAYTNYVRYDVFHVVELRDPAFKAAHGALLRVRHAEPNLYAQVPQETRRRIYAVSPTFAQLEPYLEDPRYGGRWGEIAERYLKLGRPNPADIRGSWFLWGLRRGAADLGYHDTAAEAREFYWQIADEVNAACAEGRLDCDRPRASLSLPFRLEYVPLLIRFGAHAVWKLCTLESLLYAVDRDDPYGDIDDLDWELFRQAARGRLLRDDAQTAAATGERPYAARLAVLRALRDAYPFLLAPLFLGGTLAFGLQSAADVRRRGLSLSTVVCGAILTAIAARIGILSFISVTSFDGLEPRYLGPLYPLCILVFGLSLARLAEAEK